MIRRQHNRFFLAALFAGALLGSGGLLLLAHLSHPICYHLAETATPEMAFAVHVRTVSRGGIQGGDIANANLFCAEGLLPGVSVTAASATAKLDSWAARVKCETERHYYKFRQTPAEYQNSEAYFKTLVLITVLQQDFGIHYNPEKITAPDFSRQGQTVESSAIPG